ncbi:FYVE, RhoGEF and PH domain-containing protein 5 [Electrophorus electricus]|uniref:FYVE, RhoGEF and PH domain-containing protein 5 n=1 Tax=Electrophorus electricus TaxID=8005 RepID=UPI0015D0A984|nr:FYVE, RhoGEF and PH domain-containing protein 5 [Electrophorus electricus]
MSSELQEHNLDYTSQTYTQSACKGQFGAQVLGKRLHFQGSKSTIASKPRSNSQQLYSSKNYSKRQTNKNLKPVNLDQHMPNIHRNKMLRRWKESRQKEALEQREESKTWKNIERKEGAMKGVELTQADKKEWDDVLGPGEELGCGEELAQSGELDWEVGLEQGKEFDSDEGKDSLELLSDSCSDREEEMRAVVGWLNREEEGWEVVRNSKTGSLKVPVDGCFVVQSATQKCDEQIVHNDGLNINQTHTSVKLYDKAYTDGLFTDEMFSNRFYQNHIFSNEINTNELCLDKTDTVCMFPDVCDAGEALADVDGLFECDLFEQSKPSGTLEIEEVGDHGDTVMLSVGEGSESSNGSLSSFIEEYGKESKQDNKELLENPSPLLGKSSPDMQTGISQDPSHTDDPLDLKSDREAGILSELSHQPGSSSSSLCSSEAMTTYDEMERNYAIPSQSALSKSTSSDFSMTSELELPFASSAVCFKPIHKKSQQTQVEQCDGQKEESSEVQDGQSVIATERSQAVPEEHVYEETEPKFQSKTFLQTRKYLMTRSISVETPPNGLNQMSPTLSGKERLMLHPQSCYRHNFLGDSLPTLTGSLGCLSQESSCPSNDLCINTMQIPPPFELSSITKRPIRKSTPALPNDISASCRKLDFGFKRYFLPLRFLRKSERRSLADSRSVSSRSSSESSPQESCKRFSIIRQNVGTIEPQRAHNCSLPSSPSSFLLHKNKQRPGLTTHHNNSVTVTTAPSSWDMLGVEPDDFVHYPFVKPLPFLKPRSFSSPNVDSSVYENVLNTNPHYENVQLRLLNPSSQNQRSQSSANDTDGYVDMSSLPGFQSKGQSSEQETESAYTICSPNVWCDGSVSVSVGMPCTKKEERKSSERLTVNYSRAFYTAKELLDSETQHVKTLKLLSENIDANEKLREFWGELPVIYSLHQDLISQLETRIKEWDQNDGIADIILAKKVDFSVFSSFISHHDNRMKALDEMDNTLDGNCLKQQLLQVIVRVLQYHVLLTDYLNNISPDSREYEDAQAALAVVSDVADQANNNLKNGADLLRLVRIEHSVLGLKNLLQPGRLFVKEGTLMKVSRKSKQPRHLFLMSDIMLYTYPQQDGKYRLINTLALTGMEVTKLLVENNYQNALKIEVKDICITLSACTSIERDDWFVTLNRTIADLGSFLEVPSGGFKKPGVCLGENAPSMVSVSQVAVCMNCPVHFSLTHRRHHCHACGKVVCRDCCRNKVPLKYMKNKRAKVCDKCYSELSKHEGDVAMVTENLSRPLSAVFQNIHPPNLWRGRKGQVSFNQVTGSEGEMSGTLQRSRNSKRSWKSLWFLLKDKVLYTYPQPEERLACESLPLLGFSVRSESEGDSSMFQLYHKTTLYYTFKAQDMHTAQRWVNAMEEATVL